MDALLRRRSMIAAGGGSPTPPAVMIPYIRGGADGSYINTGINPDNTTRVIVWARNWNPGGGIICGTRNGANVENFFLASNFGTPWAMTVGYKSSATASGDVASLLSGYHKYELNNNKLLVDDVEITSVTSSTISCSYALHLFGLNGSGTHANMNYNVDVCACKIYKGGTLVRDFTPVNTPSVGLYDSVSQTVFANAGNGSFTYGEFNLNAYTPLEYIECTGAQYFNSGIYGSNTLPFILKYMPKGSAAWPVAFGAKTSNSSKRYAVSFGNNTTPYNDIYFEYAGGLKAISPSLTVVDAACWFTKNNSNSFAAFYGTSSIGTATATAATFTTDYKIYVGCTNSAGNPASYGSGRIYYLSFGSSRSFVPAKKGGLVGMYDNYNDVFYPSATSTPFIAGPTI